MTQLTVSRTTIAWGSRFATLWALTNTIDLINLALSHLSYRLVEAPALRLKVRAPA